MPELLESPFADLIGGENGAPAYQVVAGRFSEVPKADAVTPLDLGAFRDMVPGPGRDVEMPAVEQDLGIFQGYVPESPTRESEKALAEVPKPPDPKWINFEKSIENATGFPFHQVHNSIRVFGQSAGRYIFDGMQAFERGRAQYYKNPTPEAVELQGDQLFLPDGSRMSQEDETALENRYRDELASHAPAALENAAELKKRSDTAERHTPVDPALAETVPARLAAAAGPVAVMTGESLVPALGLPLMVMHGALATEQEALDAGSTPEQATRAAIRSAIGLGIFGGASKLAAAAVAKVLPRLVKDPAQLARFVTQFVGQEAANETSSRAISAWNAATDAPEGEKLQAAVGAATETNLENTVMNTMYALAHAAKASRGPEKPPTSPVSEPVEPTAAMPGGTPETAQGVEPAREGGPGNRPAGAMSPVSDSASNAPELPTTQSEAILPDQEQSQAIPLSSAKIEPARPEPTASAPNAASRISQPTVPVELVPEHLRRDPSVERLLSEPAATVKPEMKRANAGEGGALFSRGGARATVTPKGSTPKGDSNFLRIEPGWKRLGSGLERKGAADVLADTKNKVGQMLSNAAKKHVDTEQEIFGQLHAKFDQALQGPRKTIDKAFDELEPYLAARENGRPSPTLSPKAQEILHAWEDVAETTGNLARANGVQVFDPTTGSHRPMGNLGRSYLPRVMKPEVERVMQDPKKNPVLWNDLVDAFARHRGIPDVEAAKELRAEAGRFSSTDYMGNLERARTGQLPEIFYDYDLRRVASQYIPSFSERMSQIIAYGQRLGPREQPLRPNLWDVARGEAENAYTQTWLTAAEDQAVNRRSKTASGVGMARAQTLASGLLLSSPTTSVIRNTLSGLTSTAEVLGIRRSLKPMMMAVRRAERASAREMGAVRQDIGDFFHADKLGQTPIDDAVRAVTDKALKWSGYNGSEVFVRTHAALTASQFAKDGIAAIARRPSSMRSKEALAMFKRMGVDAQTIINEGADWKSGPETRKFIRTVIRDTQGGYRFDQVPLWANSNLGRFFYQFGRWGTQRARNIWKNGIKPALGEEVKWHGKTMTRRDIRPLAKMGASAVLLGEAFAAVAAGFFGRDRRDSSLEEITQAWKEDQKAAVGLAFERTLNDIIMAGTLGIWSQPVDFAKSLKDQSRLKNPTEPPGLGSTKALVTLGQAALDQNGDLTKRDLLTFAGNVVPGAKQLSDVARNVFDEPLYEAQNDVRTLRGAAQRWAKRQGLDVSPRIKGDFRKSPMAPIYEPIKEALLVGDHQRAKVLATEFLNKQADRSKAATSLRASIRQSQPFRAGPYTSPTMANNFKTWARKNLNEDDYHQVERIQARYLKAAQAANLW